MLEKQADDGAGDRGDHDVPEKALVHLYLALAGTGREAEAEAAQDELHPVVDEIEDDGDQGADVESDVKCHARIGERVPKPRGEPWHENQVRGAADGQKFGETLDDGQYDRLPKK